jgi:hypothetical protein
VGAVSGRHGPDYVARKRGNTAHVPSRNDLLLAKLEELQQNLRDLVRTLTRDPAKEARKERAWMIMSGAFTAVAAIVARRAAAKIWGILTGEAAPNAKQPPAPARAGPSTRRSEDQPAAEAETTVTHS